MLNSMVRGNIHPKAFVAVAVSLFSLLGFLLLAQTALAWIPSSVEVRASGVTRPETTATASPTTCGLTWRVVSSPNVGTNSNSLSDIAVVSDNDIWAVGSYYDGIGRTLTMHWNGTQWSIVPSPNPNPSANSLRGVVALSSNDVWAVGYAGNNPGRTLIIHWNGTQWSVVPSPNVGGDLTNILYSIAAIAPNDIWAVGYYSNGGQRTLTMHWDGVQWSIVTSPNPGNSDRYLHDIAAASSNDVWAVGTYVTNSAFHTLTIHWDGTQWSVVRTPDEGNVLGGVAIAAPNDVWAVGQNAVTGQQSPGPLMLHWDGSSWAVVPGPYIPGGNSSLNAVTAISANNVWAAGWNNGSNPSSQTLIMHWDGSEWSRADSPNPSFSTNELTGITHLSANRLWAVGIYSNGAQPAQTLVERYNDPCTTPVPNSPSATRTPVPSTPTITPTSVPTQTRTPATTPSSTPSPSLTCGPAWRVVSSPNVGSRKNFLFDVAAISANDIWAVGRYENEFGTYPRTLTMHWNGTQWSVVPSPNVGLEWNTLQGVTAISTNDVWAVGYYGNGNTQTLTMRWNGTQWNIVPSPNPSAVSDLYRVAAVSATDVWAVGGYVSDGRRTLTMRWNGTQWSIVPSPNLGTTNEFNYLNDVAALSANDVWAVGYGSQAFAMHWDGTQWSIVPIPGPPSVLNAVAMVATNDVWAVGMTATGTSTVHWDGAQWTVVPSPSIMDTSELLGITAVSTNDVWAVGLGFDTDEGLYDSLTLHWNGAQWSRIPSPNPGLAQNIFISVDHVTTNDIWAVGIHADTTTSDGPYHTLVERYSNPCATPVQNSPTATPTLTRTSTPTSTYTPTQQIPSSTPIATNISTHTPMATATATGTYTSVPTSTSQPTYTSTAAPTNVPGYTPTMLPTSTNTAVIPSATTTNTPVPTNTLPPTNTPVLPTFTHSPVNTPIPVTTATSTACALTFIDVASDSSFYAPVRCLACRGLVSGYANGTFRPDAHVTRGQLAKIVSNAAGFLEDPGAQIYQDVAPDSTFYQWINRLSRRGYMSGYACGGPGEPCLQDGKPYFRPAANATRAQTAKIVANAANYTDVSTEQTFEDVPPGHPFYSHIQRLASRSIMGGYPCGSTGEPCGSSNRAYFRPYNNVTRGQSAKIVANAFYPGCDTP